MAGMMSTPTSEDGGRHASSESESSRDEASVCDEAKNRSSVVSDSSRLFQSHRCVGVWTSGRAFHVESPARSSAETFVTIPIEDRFHIIKCDKLTPVLVSDSVSADIHHVASDSSLRITVATHGTGHRAAHVSLFNRTKLAHSHLSLASSLWTNRWSVVHMLPLGKHKQTTEQQQQQPSLSYLLVALLCCDSSSSHQQQQQQQHEDMLVLGHDTDDEDSQAEQPDESSTSSNLHTCHGEVIILQASTHSLIIRNRIPLPSRFYPTVAIHPSTYINKILLGSATGAMLLLNIRSRKVIHRFDSVTTHKITALEQSPAVDTVAVGTSLGSVHLLNLRRNVLLFTLTHSNNHAVTSMSFRTDGAALQYGIAPLAVGLDDGTISVWDLQQQHSTKLLCQMDKVHPGGVSSLTYLPQEPLLLSTGTKSNSIIMHVFDSPDHSARVLRQRSAHSSPPTLIRYLHPSILGTMADGTDAATCQMLSASAGDRTLRVFSTARSVLDAEYSQGKGLAKRAHKIDSEKTELLLRPVLAMAFSPGKRDWGDLVTIHRDCAMAYVWSTKRKAQSGPVLRQDNWNISEMQLPPPTEAHATAIAMSSCGHFALIGTRGGIIYKYNVQSGLPRGTYPHDATTTKSRGSSGLAGDVRRTTKALERGWKLPLFSNKDDATAVKLVEERKMAHMKLARHDNAAVVGLAVDSLNKTLISVGTDAKLLLWSFATHAPHKRSPMTIPCPATKMCHARDSNLAAIALNDFNVLLLDCSSLSIVRRFGMGHLAPVTDLAFGPDGRRLFTSSLDGTIRVWDVPTNTCVDWMSFATPPTSITLSATGEFLASTHEHKLGISLWCDKSFFQTVHLNGTPLTEPVRMNEPCPIADVDSIVNLEERWTDTNTIVVPSTESVKNNNDDDENPTIASTTTPPKAKGLVTLSGLPAGHWKNLFHLELVKERNKPKEAPKKPPSAPFFLQWRKGLSTNDDAALELLETRKKPTKDDDQWNAAWSVDDDDDNNTLIGGGVRDDNDDVLSNDEKRVGKRIVVASARFHKGGAATDGYNDNDVDPNKKRVKVTHFRSTLAALLQECAPSNAFDRVTKHVATMGPSAIDIAFSTLCHGMHDLDEGLPLLHYTSLWLLEAYQSRQNYDASNAYLHRFLYLHSTTIATILHQDDDDDDDIVDDMSGIIDEDDAMKQKRQTIRVAFVETIGKLKDAQWLASETLRNKMQHTLCLLRHFSRMV